MLNYEDLFLLDSKIKFLAFFLKKKILKKAITFYIKGFILHSPGVKITGFIFFILYSYKNRILGLFNFHHW